VTAVYEHQDILIL